MPSVLQTLALLLAATLSVLALPNHALKRQFDCPPGIPCGNGPQCTIYDCEIPGCTDAFVCQDINNKRSPETGIAHPICDICIVGPNGVPVCGCTTAPGPAPEKRAAEPCPEYCIITDDGKLLCGCAALGHGPVGPGSEKREAKVCPLFCITTDDGETLCGCAAEDYEKAHGG